VLLAALLAGAVLLTVHYRGEAASLRSAAVRDHRGAGPVVLSAAVAALPPAGPLAGEVTAVTARPSGGQAQVIVTARITGGRADARYELSGSDCAGHTTERTWAAGITSSGGSATLTGTTQAARLGQEYYLLLTGPGIAQDHPGPGVHGWFGTTHGWSAVHGQIAPCAP
jgi:hypothetical protein